jgi:hypothetical protein
LGIHGRVAVNIERGGTTWGESIRQERPHLEPNRGVAHRIQTQIHLVQTRLIDLEVPVGGYGEGCGRSRNGPAVRGGQSDSVSVRAVHARQVGGRRTVGQEGGGDAGCGRQVVTKGRNLDIRTVVGPRGGPGRWGGLVQDGRTGLEKRIEVIVQSGVCDGQG